MQNGINTLLDMLQFVAHHFVETATRFAAWEKIAGEGRRTDRVDLNAARQLCTELGAFGTECLLHGLSSSQHQCDRIVQGLQARNMVVSCLDLRDDLRELRRRVEDDLKSEVFMHLSIQEAALYNYPTRDWEQVIKRFPETQIDIEECSKCFALERYGASLFHVLLVAEYGVVKLAKLLGVAGDKPGWGALGRLEKIAQKPHKERSRLEQQHSSVIDGMMPFAHSIKNEWRHKISHVENKLQWQDTDFSPKMAGDIISAVRGFMDKLTSDLP